MLLALALLTFCTSLPVMLGAIALDTRMPQVPMLAAAEAVAGPTTLLLTTKLSMPPVDTVAVPKA